MQMHNWNCFLELAIAHLQSVPYGRVRLYNSNRTVHTLTQNSTNNPPLRLLYTTHTEPVACTCHTPTQLKVAQSDHDSQDQTEDERLECGRHDLSRICFTAWCTSQNGTGPWHRPMASARGIGPWPQPRTAHAYCLALASIKQRRPSHAMLLVAPATLPLTLAAPPTLPPCLRDGWIPCSASVW